MEAKDFSEADFLKLKELPKFLRVSPATIFRLLKKNNFPKPFLVINSKLWLKSEILEYLKKTRDEASE